MIGRLIFADGLVATLSDTAEWACEDSPAVAEYLNRYFGRDQMSPADGVRGRKQVVEAAADLHAEYELEKLPDEQIVLDEMIY